MWGALSGGKNGIKQRMILNAVSTLKNENGAKITLVSTLKKALIQKLFSVSAAGKNLKEKIFFVSTFLDKYRM
jgi:hypothetical protein